MPSLLPLLARASRALRHRNYRLLFIGQAVSLTGTWAQQIAMGWLVYRLTGSAFALGAISFASQLPAFLLAPLAGVLADRYDRRRILYGTQTTAMAQASVLAALVLTGAIEVWHLMLLAVVVGAATGVDIPTRQALFIDLVEGPEDLPNAIALNSSLFNATRLLGPSAAGFMIAAVGEGPVFALNALTYVPLLWALRSMDLPRAEAAAAPPNMLAQLREGLGYAFRFRPIRALLLLLAALSLFGMPYIVLLPVFASDVLDRGPETLGLLMGAASLGALVGALFLAARESVRGLSRVILAAAVLFGAGLIGFAASRWLPLSLALLMVAGFGMMVQSAANNTILQTLVDPDKRGRVMSLYTAAFMGMGTIGSLGAGVAASALGAPAAVALGGAACLTAAVWFARERPRLRAIVRPIYREMGILPEVASGLGAASELRRPS